MSIKEIIDHLDELEKFDVESEENRRALREAIALLRTHPDNQPNEPLTFEELKKMNGQPVWRQHDEGVDYWVLVTVRASKMVVRDQYGMTGDVEVLMKRGERYYRRPPKEG